MGWADALPAVGTAIGGIAGAGAQNGYTAQELGIDQDAYQRALQLIMGGQLGYTPAQATGVGSSAMAGVQADQGSVMAEKQALAELQQASREGYNVVDKAAINALMSDVAQKERGSRDAALAHVQPGSGQDIAARLMAQSNAAGQANQNAMNIAAGSRQKALDSLGQTGQLASNMRSQSFNEGAARAQGQDAIAKFNAGIGQFNAGAQNTAMEQGINNRLAGADALRGAGQDYTKGLATAGSNAFNQAAGLGGAIGNGAAALGKGAGGNGQGSYNPSTDNSQNLASNANNSYPGGGNYGYGQGAPSDPSEWEGWGDFNG